MIRRYRNRQEAGRALVSRLGAYRDRACVVVALPRGGVAVASEISKALSAPIDVYPVRKLRVPGSEEIAFGVVAPGGVRILDPEVIQNLRIPEAVISAVTSQERWEIERKERAYRGELLPVSLRGRTVILADEGLETAATMHAAIAAVGRWQPARIIVAVGVASPAACDELTGEVSRIVCPLVIEPFDSVSRWYEDFHQLNDDEVLSLVKACAHSERAA